jgi:crossover junction endodeoxyribonuclease RusA
MTDRLLRHLVNDPRVWTPPPPVRFTVYGIAIPKGSTRAFRRGAHVVVTTDNPNLANWESAVRYAAATVAERSQYRLFEGGVAVTVAFHLPRPRSVSPGRRPYPITRPDLDKAARGILDPLTGVLYHDDAQVIDLHASKRYTDGPAHAEIEVREVLEHI